MTRATHSTAPFLSDYDVHLIGDGKHYRTSPNIPSMDRGTKTVGYTVTGRRFNEWSHQEFPDVMTMAEESTAWPMISRPPYVGGVGLGFMWNMDGQGA
jgi:1,4-alpha-glucan branching enzyme